jgi:hypothetical protein
MSMEIRAETSPTQRRQELIEKYWAGDMAPIFARGNGFRALPADRRIKLNTDPGAELHHDRKTLGTGP